MRDLFFVLLCLLAVVSCVPLVVLDFVRHGAREPIGDHSPVLPGKRWPAPGQLTELGMRQHLSLGKSRRELYSELLPAEYDPEVVYVRSTDFNRTIMSALRYMKGMYPNVSRHGRTMYYDAAEGKTVTLVSGDEMREFEVHTTPMEKDQLLILESCPYARKVIHGFYSTDEYHAIVHRFDDVWEAIAKQSSIGDLHQGINAFAVADYLLCAAAEGILPPHISREHIGRLEEFLGLMLRGMVTSDSRLSAIWTAALSQEILTVLDGAATRRSKVRYALYAAHDITLTVILAALRDRVNATIDWDRTPGFASSVLLELNHGPGEEELGVRVLYQGRLIHSEPYKKFREKLEAAANEQKNITEACLV